MVMVAEILTIQCRYCRICCGSSYSRSEHPIIGNAIGCDSHNSRLWELPSDKYSRSSMLNIFTMRYWSKLSAGNESQPGVDISAGRSVLRRVCTHPGNLPYTVHQSPVAIPNHHEGLGSERTRNYCHQSASSQGFSTLNTPVLANVYNCISFPQLTVSLYCQINIPRYTAHRILT